MTKNYLLFLSKYKGNSYYSSLSGVVVFGPFDVVGSVYFSRLINKERSFLSIQPSPVSLQSIPTLRLIL